MPILNNGVKKCNVKKNCILKYNNCTMPLVHGFSVKEYVIRIISIVF